MSLFSYNSYKSFCKAKRLIREAPFFQTYVGVHNGVFRKTRFFPSPSYVVGASKQAPFITYNDNQGANKAPSDPLSSLFSSLIRGGFLRREVFSSFRGAHIQAKKETSETTTKVRSTQKPSGEVVSITYEEIGLFPRSFSRVLDRFIKQVFSDVENLVIQEYRFYRYLFLTTLKCLFILILVPFFVNFIAKTYLVRPLTEYFWNTKQTEIFLNSYQQKHAFSELKDFEEKFYFESLIYPKTIAEQKNQSIETPYLSNVKGQAGNFKEGLTNTNTNKGPLKEGPVWKNQAFSNELLGVSGSLPESVNSPDLLSLRDLPYYSPNNKDNVLERTLVKITPLQSRKGPPTSPLLYEPLLFHMGEEEDLNEQKNNLQTKINVYSDEKTESLINSYSLKSSLFVYQTQEADKNIQQRYQEKTIELAQRYNDQSIEAITNFFADLISLLTLLYLLYALEIQINITKSFLLEVFFGLDDSKKSLLILLITDLLVGYHSSNLWELFFAFLFNHYGIPESQTGIFLLVATLPVLLDVLFKYLIFRHLNRSSPATVATYHAMIE